MPYGTIKVDNITFTDNSVDKTVSLSGLIQNPTFTGNVTATGTISGDVIRGGTTISGVTVTGTTANFVSGVFTTQVSGTTITGTTVATTTGSFVSLTGTTATFTSGIIASGTAALPSLAILSDPNTGIYSPGADQLAISTNGTGRITVDGSGNVNIDSNTLYVDAVNNRVGITTILPQAELNVAKTGSAATVYIESDAGNNATTSILRFGGASGRSASIQGFRGASSNIQSLDFYTYNTGDAFGMRLTSTGLGIGTTAPNRKLEVSDASADNFIRVNTTGATKSGIEFAIGGTVYSQFYFNNVPPYDLSLLQQYTTGSLILGTNSTERARIDSSGRLLVGTSSTSGNGCLLQVRNDSTALAIEIQRSSDNSSAPAMYFTKSRGTQGSPTEVSSGDQLGVIAFSGYDGAGYKDAAYIIAECDGAWTDGGDTTDNPGRLVFSVTADGGSPPTSSPPAMTIKSSQEVLIGTSTITANGGILQLKSGITFPATAVAASDANTLDDYEEGTWTPTQGAGLTVVGTFSSGGHYTKVGRQVTVQGYVAGSTSVAATTASILCEGLPFVAKAAALAQCVGSGSNASVTALINVLVNQSTTQVYAVTAMAATTTIHFTVSYLT